MPLPPQLAPAFTFVHSRYHSILQFRTDFHIHKQVAGMSLRWPAFCWMSPGKNERMQVQELTITGVLTACQRRGNNTSY